MRQAMHIIRIAAIATILLAAPVRADESWKQFDTDENGELSFAEFTQLRITQYAALDLGVG